MLDKPASLILPSFDFSSATGLSVDQRFTLAIEAIGQKQQRTSYPNYSDEFGEIPTIPPKGATAEEIGRLEQDIGSSLPLEYRDFLKRWRYLEVADGCRIWGLDWQGTYPYGSPWVSSEHAPPARCLVIGDYARYADGDQLLLKLESMDPAVLLYLHEDGPKVEVYAPSFSLAIWRLAHEDRS